MQAKKASFQKEKGEREAQANSALPIHQYRDELVQTILSNPSTIVVGETGSGKSTQLPQFLLQATKKKRIVCTQPRRVAATSVAKRVASERQVTLGNEVGYSIRFEDKSNESTRIKFVTDGVLLRECMGDPTLSRYDFVILDEAHERSLQTDILMGLLKEIQERRPSLRIVVMSATLQIDLYMNFFKESKLVSIPGRQHPVDVYYASEPVDDYVDAAMLTCCQIHAEEELGGVLVFLPGQDDIENLQALLEDNLPSVTMHGSHGSISNGHKHHEQPHQKTSGSISNTGIRNYEILPLYAAMNPEDQMAVFAPSPAGVRKFILATNIAETSVTITGIKYVVDTGFVKSRELQALTGVEMLRVCPVSKAQANQRAGRSGRESAGKCFRLYTEPVFEELEEMTQPEIQRVNLTQVVLQLKSLGVTNPVQFPYLSPPSISALKKALETLLLLGALNKDQTLTDHGKRMSQLPLEPVYAHLLLRSQELGCVSEILTAVSLLSTDNLFLIPHREDHKRQAARAHKMFASVDGDLPTLVNIYAAWMKVKRDSHWTHQHFLSHRALVHAHSVRLQLESLLQKIDIDTTISCAPAREPFLRCLASGLFLNAARRNETRGDVGLSGNERRASNGKFGKGGWKNGVFIMKKEKEAPYRSLKGGQPVHVHPSSVLFSTPNGRKLPQYVVYSEILITSKQYMRGITAIEGSWLAELVPGAFKRPAGATTSTSASTDTVDNSSKAKNDADSQASKRQRIERPKSR
jgi:HrpA-like RNA helicase